MENDSMGIQKITNSIMDRAMKGMIQTQFKTLGCSIKKTIGEYDIVVSGRDPDLVIKGFIEFEKLCSKKLKGKRV